MSARSYSCSLVCVSFCRMVVRLYLDGFSSFLSPGWGPGRCGRKQNRNHQIHWGCEVCPWVSDGGCIHVHVCVYLSVYVFILIQLNVQN